MKKINFIKLIYYINITIVLAIVFFAATIPVFADSALGGLDDAAGQGYLGNNSDIDGSGIITSIPGAIGRIVGVALSFVGLAFFILMIYGGFVWMFARGNDQDVQKAKDIIQSAIIGLIIVLAAYAITMFIGNALTTESGPGNNGSPYLPRV